MAPRLLQLCRCTARLACAAGRRSGAPWPAGRQLLRAAAHSGRVEPPDVRKLAKMAQISVTDEEVRDWGPKLEQIADWFDQLQAVDVEGVPPATRADLTEENLLRADVPRTFEPREALMAAAPDREGPFVKVPKIS